ncbi:L,D-transpeptidase [Terrihabitans sp. B22-R8]|uniref:L,D-transpeptidase n=1 Tax=Terrihabitans sp. B22-R8 TaxID=3425128 RepID=UPI00403D2CDD
MRSGDLLALAAIAGMAVSLALPARAAAMVDPNTGQRIVAKYRMAASPIAREVVPAPAGHKSGTVIVNTTERRLYLVQADGTALKYGIGVGKDGFQWHGVHSVTMKREWPDWRPPAAMLKRRPDLPRFMPGGVNNPLGARAMYLGSTIYRIHGSNEPQTIGQAVSSGCFRMTNEDVMDLYERVKVGAKVVVLR